MFAENKTVCLMLLAMLYLNNSCFSQNYPHTIAEIPEPPGFNRIEIEKGSFAEFLRKMKLMKPGSAVLDFKGNKFKQANDTTVAAVIDMDIKGRRLEQCMDIIVRFYSEYLWQKNRAQNLMLPLPGGYTLSWKEWKQGLRPFFKGVHITKKNTAKVDSSKENFNKYLNLIYSESHTQQYYFRLEEVQPNQVQIGNVIIKKGTKGHAVLIVDLAHDKDGNLCALIGNGDTPACQFFILNFKKGIPWFPLDFEEDILPLPLRKKMSLDGLRRFKN